MQWRSYVSKAILPNVNNFLPRISCLLVAKVGSSVIPPRWLKVKVVGAKAPPPSFYALHSHLCNLILLVERLLPLHLLDFIQHNLSAAPQIPQRWRVQGLNPGLL